MNLYEKISAELDATFEEWDDEVFNEEDIITKVVYTHSEKEYTIIFYDYRGSYSAFVEGLEDFFSEPDMENLGRLISICKLRQMRKEMEEESQRQRDLAQNLFPNANLDKHIKPPEQKASIDPKDRGNLDEKQLQDLLERYLQVEQEKKANDWEDAAKAMAEMMKVSVANETPVVTATQKPKTRFDKFIEWL